MMCHHSLYVFLASVMLLGSHAQEDFQIVDSRTALADGFNATIDSEDPYYYILLNGERLTNIRQASDMALGVNGAQIDLAAGLNAANIGFSSVLRIVKTHPRDTDRDGIDDVYELERLNILNPLDGADAAFDPDGDMLSHYEDYLIAQGTPSTVIATTPLHGEQRVAVTRETAVKLSRPLANGAVVTSDAFYASFGNTHIPARVHLSADRQTLTLFYQANLPAQTRVTVSLDSLHLADHLGLGVDGDHDGIPGGLFQMSFDTLALSTIPNTTVRGRVFASELGEGPGGVPINTPLEAVKISVDGRENDLFTFSDNLGNFVLDPAPAGRFFVHIDGSTATGIPMGAYYPTVGKAWESQAGVETDLGNVYLPLIVPETLQPVSSTTTTIVSFPNAVLTNFPEFAGVQLTVPPDALLKPDGSRGGSIGIAPVAPDRLPGTLPPELNFPLVITVQTDGARNFDEPIPVCFPNAPDPLTGQPLAPGEPAILYSFNHDSGRWEAVGTGTVSPDGSMICSDPGSGLLAPGWHAFIPCVIKYFQEGHSLYESIQFAAVAGCEPPPDPNNPPPCEFGIEACVADCRAELRAKIRKATLFLEKREECCDRRFPDSTSNENIDCNADAYNRFHRAVHLAEIEARECIDSCVEDCSPTNEFFCAGGAEGCLGACELDRDCKLRIVEAAFAGRVEVCNALFADDSFDTLLMCLQDANAFRIRETAKVLDEYKKCIDRCEKCPDGGGVPPAVAPIPPQLRARAPAPVETPLEAVDRLLLERVYVFNTLLDDPHAPNADALRAELDALLAQADQLAGGDAHALLEVATRAEEERLIDSGVWSDVSNPPANPLLYAADIEMPNGDFYTLRGLTGPFGKSELTVPDTDRLLSILYYDPPTQRVSIIHPFRNPVYEFVLPAIFLTNLPVDTPDRDEDGLPDLVEAVYGTDPDNPDSDGDGISDGGEVDLGTNPLDGLPAATGLIAAVDTPGTARDIWADNHLAAVSTETGVSIFNIFSPTEPVLVSQVETPGLARRVAASGSLLAVADNAEGLAIINLDDPARVEPAWQVTFGSDVVAVTAQDKIAYAALADGRIAMVEMTRGVTLGFLDSVGARAQDLLAVDEQLYSLTTEALYTYRPDEGPAHIAQVSSPHPGGPQNWRLAPGGDILYAVHGRGYNTFDLANPTNPVLITATVAAEFGWRDFADGGSGRGVATVGVNSSFTGSGAHNLRVYDVSHPATTDVLLATFDTPDDALAVEIHNGIAYAVDFREGLRVVNYLAYDNLGIPPALTVDANFDIHGTGDLEANARGVVRAALVDDVQVRNVEFFLDGERMWTDATFPFEYRFDMPIRTNGVPLVLEVVASDTGGNRTAQSFDLNVLPDITAPSILVFTPEPRLTISNALARISFTESMDVIAALNSIQLADSNGVPVNLLVEDLGDGRDFLLSVASTLPFGVYTAIVTTGTVDRAGNPLAMSQRFEIYQIPNDSDGDCIPDDVELTLGLNPLRVDSNGDGTFDGQEDPDADGAVNCQEILIGTDLAVPDTDGDTLNDGMELAESTDPLHPDSDRDGYLDGEEVEFASSPLDGGSIPTAVQTPHTQVASPPIGVLNEVLPLFIPITDAASPVISVDNDLP